MIELVVAILAGLVPTIPAAIYFLHRRRTALASATRGLVVGLNGLNVVLGLMVGFTFDSNSGRTGRAGCRG
jgi:hypothetical protein